MVLNLALSVARSVPVCCSSHWPRKWVLSLQYPTTPLPTRTHSLRHLSAGPPRPTGLLPTSTVLPSRRRPSWGRVPATARLPARAPPAAANDTGLPSEDLTKEALEVLTLEVPALGADQEARLESLAQTTVLHLPPTTEPLLLQTTEPLPLQTMELHHRLTTEPLPLLTTVLLPLLTTVLLPLQISTELHPLTATVLLHPQTTVLLLQLDTAGDLLLAADDPPLTTALLVVTAVAATTMAAR